MKKFESFEDKVEEVRQWFLNDEGLYRVMLRVDNAYDFFPTLKSLGILSINDITLNHELCREVYHCCMERGSEE